MTLYTQQSPMGTRHGRNFTPTWRQTHYTIYYWSSSQPGRPTEHRPAASGRTISTDIKRIEKLGRRRHIKRQLRRETCPTSATINKAEARQRWRRGWRAAGEDGAAAARPAATSRHNRAGRAITRLQRTRPAPLPACARAVNAPLFHVPLCLRRQCHGNTAVNYLGASVSASSGGVGLSGPWPLHSPAVVEPRLSFRSRHPGVTQKNGPDNAIFVRICWVEQILIR